MNIFSKRPLFTACMLYLLFAVVGIFISSSVKIALIIAFVLLALFSLTFFVFDKAKAYTALCLVLSSAMIAVSLISSYVYFDLTAKSFEKYYDKNHTVEAMVVSENKRSENFSEYEIYVTKIDGTEKNHSAILNCTYNSVLEEGMYFVADLYAEGFDDNSGSYSQRLDMYASGIFIQYTSELESSMLITHDDSKYTRSVFSILNSHFSQIFKNNLDENTAQMSSALLLGNKYGLAPEVRRDFSRAGVSHILALSGMHMSIIMGLFMLLFKKLGINRKTCAVILSIFALLYLFITGCSESAARSVIMLLIFYMSLLFSAVPDPMTSLGVAGATLMILMPGSVFSAGFWMSFAATLGLIVYMPSFNSFLGRLMSKTNEGTRILLKPIMGFVSAIVASIFAMIPLMIVMCVFIKQISLLTPISSAVLAIPSSGAILFSLLFIPFHTIPLISDVLAYLLRGITIFMTGFCARISDMEGIVISLNYPFASIAAIVMACALLCSLAFKFKKTLTSLIPFAVSIIMLVSSILIYDNIDKNNVFVSYRNVSTVSDMVVASSDKQAIIFDLGNGSYKSYIQAADAVFDSRATEIKAIVLTKYYNAIQSSLLDLFKNYKVRELWLPKPLNQDEYNKMAPLIPIAEKNGVDVYLFEDNESLTAFSSVNINITRSKIDRSTVPIVALNIRNSYLNLLYCSSGFNESTSSDLSDYISDADYIIFGNVGPKVKKFYSLPEKNTANLVVFADKTHAAYYKANKTDTATVALVEDTCNIRLAD